MSDDFEDAILGEAARKAANDPSVRRADTRYDVVTAVNADGTVSCGEIRARRYHRYIAPAVGDAIILVQSGNRNWTAWGLLAGQDAGGWTPLTLTAGYINPSHGYTAAWLREGKRIWLRGRIGRTGEAAIPNATTMATLPAAIRPEDDVELGWISPRNQIASGPSTTRVEIAPGGILRLYEGSTLPTWIALDGVTYLTD